MWDHSLGALATYKRIITIAGCANIVSGFVNIVSSSLSSPPSIIYEQRYNFRDFLYICIKTGGYEFIVKSTLHDAICRWSQMPWSRKASKTSGMLQTSRLFRQIRPAKAHSLLFGWIIVFQRSFVRRWNERLIVSKRCHRRLMPEQQQKYFPRCQSLGILASVFAIWLFDFWTKPKRTNKTS